MSRTKIWKYPLVSDASPLADEICLRMPSIRDIIVLQLQNGVPTLWAVVDPDAQMEDVWFHVIGTDQPMPDKNLSHIGTWQQSYFVWHLFEEVT